MLRHAAELRACQSTRNTLEQSARDAARLEEVARLINTESAAGNWEVTTLSLPEHIARALRAAGYVVCHHSAASMGDVATCTISWSAPS